jgi:hypothetical protein
MALESVWEQGAVDAPPPSAAVDAVELPHPTARAAAAAGSGTRQSVAAREPPSIHP